MDKSKFLVNLENKYIDIIKHYIHKTDLTIVLTSSLENNVINFLKNQKYNYKLTNKLFTGREKNAIIDLLVATKCNNIFLSVEGSTFSFYISKLLRNNVKQLSFNLCNISEDIKIINTSTPLIYDKDKIEQNLHNFYIRAKNRRKKLYLRYLLNYYFLPLIFILLNITGIYLLI